MQRICRRGNQSSKLESAIGIARKRGIVLNAGRKTDGYIQGDVRISGFPKNQQTFARISGYCE